jgi:hypothetical protein
VTNEEITAEISALKERIENLELDIALMKTIKVSEQAHYQPWVTPNRAHTPVPHWHGPTVIC